MPAATPFRGNAIPRCAIYARFSDDDNQNESSNDDQIRECSKFAQNKDWRVLPEYIRTDSGKTGQTVAGRDGLADLLLLAAQKPRPFDYLLIFHTSRLGRDVGDANKLKATFKFFGIVLIFVSDNLDSRDSSFDTMFVIKSLQDQQFIQDLRAHVRKGQAGKFDRGFFPGGGVPFGFCLVPHEDPNQRGRYGRNKVDYVEWAIDPEEAPIVRRIFRACDLGMSYAEIAKMLNAEGVKPPRAPRLRAIGSWSKGAIKEILRNEKYIGIFRFNRSYHERNPMTGKLVRRYRPEAEWLFREMPLLGIVRQELWDRVCEQRRLRRRNAKELGGMARTPGARSYLFSGRLNCGVCGHTMYIVNSRPPRYGCSEHRERGTCHNSLTILQQVLETGLLSALASNLADKCRREELVREVKEQINRQAENRFRVADEAGSRLAELKKEKADLQRKGRTLAEQIAERGNSPILNSLLDEYETRLLAIEGEEKTLTMTPTPVLPQFTDEDVRSFVESQSTKFAQVLVGDPHRAKDEIAKRVSRLTLTPQKTAGGYVYVVTGDVALFGSEDLMQYRQGELSALHYTFPLRLEIKASRQCKRKHSPVFPSVPTGEEAPATGGGCRNRDHETVVSEGMIQSPTVGKEPSVLGNGAIPPDLVHGSPPALTRLLLPSETSSVLVPLGS